MPIRRIVLALLFVLLGPAGITGAADRPLRQKIDAEVKAAWKAAQITPSGRCSDEAFLRRVYLDLVGTIPTYEEARRFLAQTEADRRAQLIDCLLADPRFAAHQADNWELLLFGRRPTLDQSVKRESFKKWLTAKFAANEPYDQWVRELLQAEKEGTSLYYLQYRNQPEEATVAVTRTFLGTQLQCARCHDHPFDTWTQRDFYGMAGFFVRLVVVDGGGAMKPPRIAEKSTGEVLFTGSVKDQKPGQKGEPVKPRFLGGAELEEPPLPKGFKEPELKGKGELPRPAFSRKDKIAEWLTAADNPYFARAVANRLWAQFLGRGIVHPVDDLGAKNVPSHPQLLQALEEHVRQTKFDLKDLIRELVNSDTYQLDSAGPGTEALPTMYERARVRPLSAEELFAAMRVATSLPADGLKGNDPTPYLLRYFGEPMDGLGNFQASLAEHLFLNNSPHLRTLVQPRKGNLADVLATGQGGWDVKVERLFLSVLTRRPSAKEQARFVQHLSGAPAQTPALVEEAIWTLLACSEFRFNH